MTDCPHNSDSIDLVERIFCIYEQEYPILRGQLFVPNILNPVDCAVDYCFKSVTELFILTHHGSFWSCELYNSLRKKTSPGFSNSNRTNASLFVKCDHVASHKFTIGRPGRALIASQTMKIYTLVRSLLLSSPKLKDTPVGILSTYPSVLNYPKVFARPIQLCPLWCLWE